MKGGGDIPSPDPNIGRAALLQAETGRDWLGFAREAFAVSNERQADLDRLTEEVTQQQLGVARDQAGWSRDDRKRYETTFRPIEDDFIDEAKNYDSPERQAEAAATAKADIQSASADSQAQARREAASLGINPTSGRYAGIEKAGEMGTALASAGAQNNARQLVRDKGLALKADVVNLGRGLPAQSAQAAALGLSAGSSAVGLNQGANQQYIASTGIMGQGFQGQMQGYAGQANTLQNQYNSQLNAYNIQQQNRNAGWAGIGSALGGLAGLFMPSDENIKEKKEPIPDGEGLGAVKAMRVESWKYKDGVADGGEHIGTYAQDFQAATGKGDGKTIAVQDAIGLSMRAIQDLDQKVDKLASMVGLGDQRSPQKKPAKERMAA